MTRRLRSLPGPLLALLAVSVVEALAWSIVLPPLQGPDEVRHLAYVQRMVEKPGIPWTFRRRDREDYSSEVDSAIRWAQLSTLAANPTARPAWTDADVALWRSHSRGLGHAARADGQYTDAMRNPPLYYAYAALPYLVTYPASVFDRELAMRVANLPWLLLVVGATWWMAGLLFCRSWLRAVATAAVALQPQLVAMTADVAPDLMLSALWSAGLAVMVAILLRGATTRRVVALAALCGASALVQPRGLPLLIPAAVAVGIALWRTDRWRSSARCRRATVGLAALAALATPFVLVRAATGGLTLDRAREFLSYIWQFYLPRLPSMTPAPNAAYGLREVFVDRFYGTFAQLEVTLGRGLLDALAIASLLGLGLMLMGLWRHRRAVCARLDVVVVFTIAFVAELLSLHAVAFSTLADDPVLTGRYLLPLVSFFGFGVAAGVSWLPRRVGAAGGVAVVGCGVLLQLAAVGAVLGRFYG